MCPEDTDTHTSPNREERQIAHTGQRSLQAHGQAQRRPGDIEIPQVGAEVAAGRAFIP